MLKQPSGNSRSYDNHILDCEIWNKIKLRHDDIIIASAPKAGSTWMCRIVGLLIHKNPNRIDDSVMDAPWIESKELQKQTDVLKNIQAITHRRFFKTHIPLSALPFEYGVKYIHIARDTRDVFMSMLNHWALISDYLIANNRNHPPLLSSQGTIKEIWKKYTSQSVYDWEEDGWPYWSNNTYTESFWKNRNLPNILLIHYNDLLTNLSGQMKRIASFLGINDLNQNLLHEFAHAASFEVMKKDGDKLLPAYNKVFKGGAKAFIHKGFNGRWKEEFGLKELELYKRMNKRYDPDMIDWLESGYEEITH